MLDSKIYFSLNILMVHPGTKRRPKILRYLLRGFQAALVRNAVMTRMPKSVSWKIRQTFMRYQACTSALQANHQTSLTLTIGSMTMRGDAKGLLQNSVLKLLARMLKNCDSNWNVYYFTALLHPSSTITCSTFRVCSIQAQKHACSWICNYVFFP